MPDFYAQQVTAGDLYCVDAATDAILQPIYDALHLCESIKDFGFSYDENGDPLIEDCQTKNFAGYYATKESFTFADALFKNVNGLQDKFVAYWDHTSAKFAGNPYVVGYDPLNEPLAGNPFHFLGLEVPGVADRQRLDPMYSQIYEKYQANDKNAVMWFEPVPQPDSVPLAGGFTAPVGFLRPPGAEPGSPFHVLNDHSYCCAMAP